MLLYTKKNPFFLQFVAFGFQLIFQPLAGSLSMGFLDLNNSQGQVT